MTAEVIQAWFAGQPDLRVERLGDAGWFTVLAGEHKRTIPVALRLTDHDLHVESFFMAAPDENLAEVYAYLLRRNLRTYTFRFALADRGDVMLVGVLPRAAVTVEELDRALGQLLLAADECYDHALRAGFAAYIDREQAWRAKVGAPRNPIS
jgi:Putative bacterial sensory transduction regulator